MLFALALAGTVAAVWKFRRYGVFLLLWLPLPFYALSIAYGSVPIYLPVWYPFSYYNVRYGLELLPVFAVFLAVLANFILERMQRARSRIAVWVILIASWSRQLSIGLSRNPDHIAGGESEFRRPIRDGTTRWRRLSTNFRPRQRC